MNIITKLVLPMFFLSFILIGVIHLFLVPKWLQEEHDFFIQQQHGLLIALEPTITSDILSGNYADLHANLNDAMDNHTDTWRQLTVKLADGNLVYPLVEPAKADLDINIENIEHNIELANAPLAKISLLYDWSTFQKNAKQRMQDLEKFIALLFTVMITIGITLVYIMVLRPVKSLKQGAVLLAKGDFNSSLPPVNKDEIGQLTQAFLTMRNNLYEHQNNLRTALDEAQATRESLLSKQQDLNLENEKTKHALHAVKTKTVELEWHIRNLSSHTSRQCMQKSLPR